MDHAELVAEMHNVENLPTQDRLHLARMRRTQQLKVARQKEKEWQKLQRSRDKSQKHSKHNRRHLSFEKSVVLLEAAGRNDINEVAQLLQRGITPDASNEDGLTALHQCCIDNNVEMLKLLLDFGANVDAQDSDKWTPLHAAATCGHLNLVKILISRSANLLAVNTDGNMPYDLCDDEETLDYIEAEMSKRGVTQELIDETRSLTEKQMLDELIELANNGGDLEIPDHQGATPLHIAAANGYTRVVEFLLEHHASVDAVDRDLWLPVHAAACWGHPEVLDLLAQYGADLNARNKDNETPSDICEDTEIRERIEMLKSEQESKRLAEAQRRRVRRSQSNNTRAQSVRRTSIRDKTLTTKKDAAEETRLRLQAQEVFISPDSTTTSKSLGAADQQLSQRSSVNQTPHLAPIGNATNRNIAESFKGLSTVTSGISSLSNDFAVSQDQEITSTYVAATGSVKTSQCSLASAATNNNVSSNHTNNNNHHIRGSTNQSKSIVNNVNVAPAVGNVSSTYSEQNNSSSYSSLQIVDSTAHTSRRPPDGKDNDEEFIARERLVINSSGSANNLHKLSGDRSKEIFSTSKEGGKINVQVTVLVDTHHNIDNPLSVTTLANLKKQRSQSRSTTISENYSAITAIPTASVNSNSASSAAIELSNIALTTTATTLSQALPSPVSKFSGVTGDVVSDNTTSKKCCILM